MFDKSIIGAVIAENRRAVPMTQAELADRLMVSHQAVSQWERGDTLPDITLLPAIAEALGIDINALFGVKSEPVTLPMSGGKPVADAPEVQEGTRRYRRNRGIRGDRRNRGIRGDRRIGRTGRTRGAGDNDRAGAGRAGTPRLQRRKRPRREVRHKQRH